MFVDDHDRNIICEHLWPYRPDANSTRSWSVKFDWIEMVDEKQAYVGINFNFNFILQGSGILSSKKSDNKYWWNSNTVYVKILKVFEK